MGTPSRVEPVYHCIYNETGLHPTCVIAGRNRHRAWLYVHAATPMILRLHPPVVRFLRDIAAELTGGPDARVVDFGVMHRWLRKDTQQSYPECLVTGRSRNVWLNVFAATPSSVKLVPQVVDFLQNALADLPAMAAQPQADRPAEIDVTSRPHATANLPYVGAHTP